MEDSSSWIPVAGPLLGALLGFLGAYSIANLNIKNSKKQAQEGRSRERVEEIYVLALKIQEMHIDKMGHVINAIFNNMKIKEEKNYDIHPITKLLMLVNLYYPGLVEESNSLKESVDNFSKFYLGIACNDYANNTEEAKKSDLAKIGKIHNSVFESAESLKCKLHGLVNL